jgi:hypothetical protein
MKMSDERLIVPPLEMILEICGCLSGSLHVETKGGTSAASTSTKGTSRVSRPSLFLPLSLCHPFPTHI